MLFSIQNINQMSGRCWACASWTTLWRLVTLCRFCDNTEVRMGLFCDRRLILYKTLQPLETASRWSERSHCWYVGVMHPSITLQTQVYKTKLPVRQKNKWSFETPGTWRSVLRLTSGVKGDQGRKRNGFSTGFQRLKSKTEGSDAGSNNTNVQRFLTLVL